MNIVLTTGFLVMLTPYLGLPSMWETGILVFLGFLIVVRALYLKKIFKDIKKTKGNSESSSFKQNENVSLKNEIEMEAENEEDSENE